jgi:type IV pilus assembly protein PilV
MKRRLRMRDTDGFTLIELMITLAVLSIGLLALASMQVSAVKANALAKRLTLATALAEARMEEIKGLPFASVQSESPTTVTAANMSFTREVTVTANSPVANAMTVQVAVRWTDGGQTKTVPLTTILFQP